MIKVGLEGAPPFSAAGLRFIIASFVIFSILVLRRIPLPRVRAFYVLTLFLGIFQMAVPYGLVYWAEQYISSGLTAILFSTMPLMVAILARIFIGDPLSVRKIAGILIGTAGVYVIFSDGISMGHEKSVYGIAATLCSAFLASVSSIAIKKFSRGYNPFASISLPMLYGGVLLSAIGLITERDRTFVWEAPTIVSIIYLALFGSVVAFALYFWIIKHLEVTVLSYQTFIIPVLACLLGWIFLHETFTFNVAIGGGMILFGISLAVISRSSRKRYNGGNP
jgi:drug/metabolite transporter (DMT)-like permease